MTYTITYAMLKRAGACWDVLCWFAEHMPNGGTWDEVVRACLDDGHPDYAAWLGRHCPAGVEGATYAARLALQRNDYERELFDRHYPAGV